jgi:alcohol dehydrogenase
MGTGGSDTMTELRTFEMPRTERVLQGSGAAAALGEELDRRGLRRAMLVTGRSVSAGPAFAALTGALGDRVVDLYTRVEAHNPVGRVVELIDQARRADADVLVAVGGGSPIDAAKLAALGLSEGVEDVEGLARLAVRFTYPDGVEIPPQTGVPLPVIAVPTTLSAAEWDGFAGSVDAQRDTKDLYIYLNLTPVTVVLDPALCAHTPRDLWATTGVRAIDHAVETAYAKNAHPFTTSLAAGALGMLAANLTRSVSDPGDHDAALQCQIAAWLSITGVHNVSLGLSHAIGHQLGALGIPHGVTSCITLPHIMRFLEPVTEPQQAVMGRILAGSGDPAVPAADRIEVLLDELAVPRRVSDFGIARDKMDVVARATLADMVVRESPRTVDEQVVYELLELVW